MRNSVGARLATALQSSMIAASELDTVRWGLVQSCQDLIASESLSDDQIKADWGVGEGFLEYLRGSDASGTRLVANTVAAERLIYEIMTDGDLSLSGFWMSTIVTPSKISVAGRVSESYVDRWNSRAQELGVEVIWHEVPFTATELYYFIWRISNGIDCPKATIAHVQMGSSGAVVECRYDARSQDALISVLPSWITLRPEV